MLNICLSRYGGYFLLKCSFDVGDQCSDVSIFISEAQSIVPLKEIFWVSGLDAGRRMDEIHKQMTDSLQGPSVYVLMFRGTFHLPRGPQETRR